MRGGCACAAILGSPDLIRREGFHLLLETCGSDTNPTFLISAGCEGFGVVSSYATA
jgi:hypothetical protein